jgi:hypothetical protein
MSHNVFVRWGTEAPTRDELQACLEDYVRGIGAPPTWADGRLYVALPGTYSHPFTRVGPATDAMRASFQQRAADPREARGFEVFIHEDAICVITRQDDEITNNIAKGFAVLCARGWGGKLEDS